MSQQASYLLVIHKGDAWRLVLANPVSQLEKAGAGDGVVATSRDEGAASA
jgi:hypothetical protein